MPSKETQRIADLEEIIRYAIGGIDALLPENKDAIAIKETLEQAFEDNPSEWPADLRIR